MDGLTRWSECSQCFECWEKLVGIIICRIVVHGGSGMSKKSERIKAMPTLEEVEAQLLSPEERAEVDRQADKMIAAMRELQESVSSAVASYMAKEKIGFNELTLRLDTCSRPTSRLLKGEANLTMASIAELAAVMGKKARVVFE